MKKISKKNPLRLKWWGFAIALFIAVVAFATLRTPHYSRLLNRAEELKDARLYYDSLKYLDAAIKKDPQNPEAYLKKSEILSRIGRYSEVEAAVQKALELDPNNSNAYVAYGDVLAAQRWSRDGKESKNPKHSYEYVKEQYLKAIELDDKNYLPYLRLVSLFYSSGKEQMAFFDKAIELAPKKLKPELYLERGVGKIFHLKEDLISGFDDVIMARKLDPKIEAKSSLFNNELSLEFLQEGRMTAQKLEEAKAKLKDSPQDVQAVKDLARAEIELFSPEEAVKTLDKAIKLAPKDAELYFLRGKALLSRRSFLGGEDMQEVFKRGVEDIKKAIALKPDYSEVLNYRGRGVFYDPMWDKNLDTVIELDPKNYRLYVERSRLNRKTNKEQAIEDARMAQKLAPRNLAGYWAEVYTIENEKERIPLLQKMAKLDFEDTVMNPSDNFILDHNGRAKLKKAGVLVSLVFALEKDKQYSEAVRVMDDFIALNPDTLYNPGMSEKGAYAWRGFYKYFMGDMKGAVKDYTKALHSVSECCGVDNNISFFMRGMANMARGENEAAKKDFQNAVLYTEVHGFETFKSMRVEDARGDLYERYNPVIEQLETTLKQDPENAVALWGKAAERHMALDTLGAIEAAQKAISISGSPEARGYLKLEQVRGKPRYFEYK